MSATTEKTLQTIPRVSRRFASTSTGVLKPAPRRGQKGRLYGPAYEKNEQPQVTPEESVRILKRRMQKAERDERMDITHSMTPVRTYMGGFTRPSDLRTSNWWPGGRYVNLKKGYEAPPIAAYEPHTVFVLESRYPINKGLGRISCHEHIVGVCREGDLPKVLEMYNSEDCPELDLTDMDNARWPEMTSKPPNQLMRVKWWATGEDPKQIIREQLGEEYLSAAGFEESEAFAEEDPSELVHSAASKPGSSKAGQKVRRRSSAGLVPAELVAQDAHGTSVQARGAHSSRYSGWGHEENENTVPQYYVERKRQRDAIADRKEEEGDLMYELSAGIIADSVSATTRPRDEKIPTEIADEHGNLRHPSGFLIPTPGEAEVPYSERKARAMEDQTMGVAQRVLEEAVLQNAVTEGTMRAHTRPREEKIPVEVPRPDGTVAHASGFVPPVPNTKFPPSAVRNGRGLHTSATAQATESVQDTSARSSRYTGRGQEEEENVIPQYYVERKRQRDAIADRKEEEGDLMHELSAGIISDSLSATTRPRDEKIPTEIPDEHGNLRHPSGFLIPTPGEAEVPYSERKARAMEDQTMGVAQRVLEEAVLQNAVTEGTMRAHTRPREEKIPVEVPRPDGTVAHASGFVPPVPNTKFPPSAVKNGRGFHTSAAAQATEVPLPRLAPHLFPVQEHELKDAPAAEYEPEAPRKLPEPDVLLRRASYLPALRERPFWRPLMTLTFSTRPLALSVSRLSKSQPKGLPFYASISDEDRKCFLSFSSRLRNLRLNRMSQLATETSQLLSGKRGGFLGIRFSPDERGRGVDADKFAEPIPFEKRVVRAAVARWYPLAHEVKERLEADNKSLGTLETYTLDDHGYRYSDKDTLAQLVPWAEARALKANEVPDVELYEDEEMRELLRVSHPNRHEKIRRQAHARAFQREMAENLSQRHRSVVEP